MDPSKGHDLRAELLELDRQLLGALERRAELVRALLGLRTGTAKSAPTLDREHLLALVREARSLSEPAVTRAFELIDGVCRAASSKPRIACVGSEGELAWTAAIAHFGLGAELVRAEGPLAAIVEVAKQRVDFAVVPFESMKEGTIFPIVQAIAAADLRIVAERELTQSLSLVSTSGLAGEVEKIYATAGAHAAAQGTLEAHFPRATVIDVRTPLVACEHAQSDPKAAALVPRGLAGAEALALVRDDVDDDGEVRMRYAILSRLPAPPSGHDATAVLFSVHDRPGALYDVLQPFKERGCNLRRIQSRPIPGEGWDYVFYVEVDGHATDRSLVAALEGLKREAKTLKILGSFPSQERERARTA